MRDCGGGSVGGGDSMHMVRACRNGVRFEYMFGIHIFAICARAMGIVVDNNATYIYTIYTIVVQPNSGGSK